MTPGILSKIDKLDRVLRISFTAKTKISELSKEFGISAAGGLRLTEKKAEITYFFPENSEKSRELRIFLREFDAVEAEGVWRVKVEENLTINYVKLLMNLIGLNSVALTYFWLKNGIFHAEFLFHNSEIKLVSDIISLETSGIEGFSLDYLGVSEGFTEIFSKIDNSIGLQVAIIDLIPPKIELTEKNNPMGNDWVRINKLPYGSENIFGIVIPSEIPRTEERLHTIVEQELYSAKTGNDYLTYINNRKNDKRVITVGAIHTFKDGLLRVLEIIPSALSNDWLNIFYSSAEDVPDWRPQLTYFSDYKRWLEYNLAGMESLPAKEKRMAGGTLNHCAILSVKGLLPPVTKANVLRPRKSGERFHLLFNENGSWYLSQNIGQHPNELEYESARKYVKSWGGGEQLLSLNGIIRGNAPRFILPLIEKVTSAPGCRVVPDILQVGEDLHICIEFHRSTNEIANKIIEEFLQEEIPFKKELTYIGERFWNYPLLLKEYEGLGNDLNNFTVIKTVWEPTKKQLETDVMGVFQNEGTYIPKTVANSRENRLVSKLSTLDIKGRGKHTIINKTNKIVEFVIETSYFNDFYSEVVNRYTGPLFNSLTVKHGIVTNYYVVERGVEQQFVRGMYEHWKRSSRADHINYISEIKGLGDWAAINSLPF